MIQVTVSLAVHTAHNVSPVLVGLQIWVVDTLLRGSYVTPLLHLDIFVLAV